MSWTKPKPLPEIADAREVEQRVQMALQESQRVAAFVALVRELYADGFDEGEALGVLERTRAQLRIEGREAEEDDVMDVMDFVVGYCSPGQRLQRETPT